MRHWFRVNGELCLPVPSVPGCTDEEAALKLAYDALTKAGFDLEWSFDTTGENPEIPLLEWSCCMDEHQPQGKLERDRLCREGTCGHANAQDKGSFREPGTPSLEDAEYELVFSKGGPNAIGYLGKAQAKSLTSESFIEKMKGKANSVAGEYRDTNNGAQFTVRPSRKRNKLLVQEA